MLVGDTVDDTMALTKHFLKHTVIVADDEGKSILRAKLDLSLLSWYEDEPLEKPKSQVFSA